MHAQKSGPLQRKSAGKASDAMKVLDLDMDFFLTDACPLAPLGERPPGRCAQPLGDGEVIRFLEEQCGLSSAHPLPGAIFDTHDKALDFWQARLADGTLTAPFEVVHVDTHSDLAFGPPGTDFVLKAVLTRAPAARPSLEGYRHGVKLDEANYLLFALAFRWISRLTYVRNPKSREDVPVHLLRDPAHICLTSDIARLMEGRNGQEPEIPFFRVDDYRTFHETGFDFVTLAQSPRYAPASADRIMALLRPYIQEIPL